MHDETRTKISYPALIVIGTVQQLLIYEADANTLLVVTTSELGRHLVGLILERAGVIVNK